MQRSFWQANSYEQFGYTRPGKVHELDHENLGLLLCGKAIKEGLGRVVIPGAPAPNWKVEPTCKGCCARIVSRKEQLKKTQEWEARRQQLADRQEQERQEWQAQYDAYIQSDKWYLKRKAVLERDKWLCQGCRVNKAAQVHHLTYKRLGDEMLFDLISVCESCHEAIHSEP